jgi:alpha-D-xyloside xylohydrolase
VRWYQLGLFSSVFRTHGCRHGGAEPEVAPCVHVAGSCGFNEPWSYGNATAVLLTAMIRFRTEVLAPYIAELARNVSAEGVPTMRPLWYEFPDDAACYNVDDQFLLGPLYLVAPVTAQGATNRSVVFPAGARWQSVWDAAVIEPGGVTKVVQAPLDRIPAYTRI